MITIILGAIFNRIRGGWLTDLVMPKIRLKQILTKLKIWQYTKESPNGTFRGNKIISDIAFGLTLGLSAGYNIWGIILLGLGHSAGKSEGWGDYMHCLEHRKVPNNPNEVYLIDELILDGEDDPVFRGKWALNIRGVVWSFCIGISLILASLVGNNISITSSLVFFVGMPMGFIYSKTFDYCENKSRPWLVTTRLTKNPHSRGNGWALGELVFGAYFWTTIYFLVS